MALVPVMSGISELSFTTNDDLLALVSTAEARVAALEKHTFSTINVTQAFKELTIVGSLLKVAFANAGHKPCSAPIVQIIANYQDMIKDSALTTQEFVTACVKALKFHKQAMKAAEKGKPELALKCMAMCGKLAVEMAAASDVMVQKAVNLSALAEEGLVKAVTDRTISAEEKDRVEKLIYQTQAQTKHLQTTLEELAEEVDMASADETRHARAADANRKQAMFTQIISAGVKMMAGPLNAFSSEPPPPKAASDAPGGRSDAGATTAVSEAVAQKKALQQEKLELEGKIAQLTAQMKNAEPAQKPGYEADIADAQREKEAKVGAIAEMSEALSGLRASLEGAARTAEEAESKAAAKKYELMRAKRQNKADLEGKLEELKGMRAGHDDLQKAIASLKVVIVTMGRVKTTFTNVRVFWESVAKHCRLLAKGKEALEFTIELGSEIDDMKESITEQALNWAALGRVNLVAHTSMVDAAGSVDELMNDLPVGGLAALQDLATDNLLQALKDEECLVPTHPT